MLLIGKPLFLWAISHGYVSHSQRVFSNMVIIEILGTPSKFTTSFTTAKKSTKINMSGANSYIFNSCFCYMNSICFLVKSPCLHIFVIKTPSFCWCIFPQSEKFLMIIHQLLGGLVQKKILRHEKDTLNINKSPFNPHWITMKNHKHHLIGGFNPSEKWWSSSVGSQPMESHQIPWFQSPPVNCHHRWIITHQSLLSHLHRMTMKNHKHHRVFQAPFPGRQAAAGWHIGEAFTAAEVKLVQREVHTWRMETYIYIYIRIICIIYIYIYIHNI